MTVDNKMRRKENRVKEEKDEGNLQNRRIRFLFFALCEMKSNFNLHSTKLDFDYFCDSGGGGARKCQSKSQNRRGEAKRRKGNGGGGFFFCWSFAAYFLRLFSHTHTHTHTHWHTQRGVLRWSFCLRFAHMSRHFSFAFAFFRFWLSSVFKLMPIYQYQGDLNAGLFICLFSLPLYVCMYVRFCAAIF